MTAHLVDSPPTARRSGRSGGASSTAGSIRPGGGWWPAVAVFLGSVTLHLYAVALHDDQYDRISRARQMIAYGAVPFRDFFDPGYGLTLYVSAGLQWLFGHNLLGEVLLDVAAISAGLAVVYLLAARISRSPAIPFLLVGLAVITEPRYYDFDKVLFYPLGVAACWAYAARPTRGRLLALAGVTALAALFRYDNGVYLGTAALVAVTATHWGQWRAWRRRAATFAGAVVLFVTPALLVPAAQGVLLDAFDQIGTYAITEGRRTSLFRPAAFSIGRSAPLARIVESPPELPLIKVRWESRLDDPARAQLERQYGLVSGRHDSGATWWYRVRPASSFLIRQMVQDPLVRETEGIDRVRLAVRGLQEPLLDTWRRRVPVLRIELLPGWRDRDNAVAWLYYLLVLLPPAAIVSLLLDRRHRRPPPEEPATSVTVLSTAALCLLVNVFILRDPIEARLGAVAVPALILAAFLFRRPLRPAIADGDTRTGTGPLARTRRVVAVTATLVILGLTAAGLLALTTWGWRANKGEPFWPSVIATRAQRVAVSLREVPPGLDLVPRTGEVGLIRYLRECSRPSDPVMATWFAPQLYFFAGRPFAAGMAVFFGDHWRALRYQRRAIARLEQQPPSLVILEERTYDDFRTQYPFIHRYVFDRYEVSGESDFGDRAVEGWGYRILVNRALPAPPRSARWGLSCFAGGS